MLKLKELSFNGIGRFTTLQTVNLEDKSNILQVNGSNLNTGGSSGSGKSTVFHSLDYLLGINDIPSTALQNRKQKDTIYASAVFDKDGKVFRVERSKKKGLCLFTVNGDSEDPITTGSTKVAEEKLDEILGLPRDLVSKLIHKRQSDGGFFLNLRPKEIYEFLAKCLDLQHFNLKILEINQKAKTLDSSLLSLEAKKKEQQSSLLSFQESKLKFVKPERPVFNSNLSLVLDSLKYEFSIKEKQLSEKLGELKLKEPKSEYWEPDQTSLKDAKTKVELLKQELNAGRLDCQTQKMAMSKKLSELLTDYSLTLSYKKDESRIVLEIEKLENEIKTLEGCQCPTCLQSWIGDNQKQKIESKKTLLRVYNAELSTISERLSTLSGQKTVIDKLTSIIEKMSFAKEQELLTCIAIAEKQVKDIETENYKLSEKFNETQQKMWTDYNCQVNTAKYDHEQSVKSLREQISQTELLLKEELLKQKSYESNLSYYETQLNYFVEQEAKLEKSLKDIENQALATNKQKDAYLEACRCIKGYLFNVFQDSLDYIGNRATEMLSKVPHTSNCVLYFETGKENKDGTIKEEITPYINLEGDSNIPLVTLCGGERSCIDLAVDLAVNDLIESRSGKGFDWIVLDEPFDGQDTIGKEACLDLLTKEDINRRIIIVDHGSELKSMIKDCVLVERKGEDSAIAGE